MSAVEQQSQQDNILPDCMQDSPAEVSSHTDGIITAYLLYENPANYTFGWDSNLCSCPWWQTLSMVL